MLNIIIQNLPLIVQIIMPIIILFATLSFERKQNERILRNQEIQFEKRLAEDSAYYKQQLNIGEENARIANRPYLLLDKDIAVMPGGTMGSFYSHMTVSLKITNIGNGMAENIVVRTVDIGDLKHYIIKPEITNEGQIEYIYDDHLDTNVLAKNDCAVFGLSRYATLSEEYKDKGSKWIESPSWVVITLDYEDSFDNKYEQKFRFILDGKGNYDRVEIEKPVLRELNRSM